MANNNATMINIQAGKIGFDPRNMNGTMAYNVGVYDHKDKETGKAVYMNFDVVDFDKVAKEKIGKGDWVSIQGRFSTNSYTDKNGVSRTSFRVTPTKMVKIDDPFNSRNNTKVTTSSFAEEDGADWM